MDDSAMQDIFQITAEHLKQLFLNEHVMIPTTAALIVNPSKDLPYHNNAHMTGVASMATSFYCYECITQNKPIEEASLIALQIASVFHDYDYRTDEMSDACKIQIAVKHMRTAMHVFINSATRAAILDHAQRLIEVTEYPFIHTPQTVEEKCIRDADLLYPMFEGYPKITYGLFQELKDAKKLPEETTWEAFIQLQKTFLNEATIYTEAGQQCLQCYLQAYMRLLDDSSPYC